ncbi:STAS domain-containing protein [Geomicrobium sp. JCM 19038]|uniref:STAS domain-containing protein n=1 Tax=Geomicrobium sp. JCM 19038 TaxID=1460635 RepID=UPI00045F2776|nr:STAS domain-containing protein [Geomicrobium sp. JCM 19038]GAK09776.1 sulfate transporter/antisigma-factor antagonist STAS [Geomicrobium sp. JCM 19038]
MEDQSKYSLITLRDHLDEWYEDTLHEFHSHNQGDLDEFRDLIKPYATDWFNIIIGSTSIDLDQWSSQFVNFCIGKRFTSDHLLLLFRSFRTAFQQLLVKKVEMNILSSRQAFELIIDVASRWEGLFESVCRQYMSFQVQTIELTRKEMYAVSIPLVPVWKGVAVLPIIGDLDDERSTYLQNQTLNRATELSLTCIVIDLSGINSINTWFAQNLSNLIQALRLLGIIVVLSGMRPELSQTIVRLGIRFKNTRTYLTLEQALQSIEPAKLDENRYNLEENRHQDK